MKIKRFGIIVVLMLTVAFVLTSCGKASSNVSNNSSVFSSNSLKTTEKDNFSKIGKFTTKQSNDTSRYAVLCVGGVDEDSKVLFDDIKLVGNNNYTYVIYDDITYVPSTYHSMVFYTFPEDETYEVYVRDGVEVGNACVYYYNNNTGKDKEFSMDTIIEDEENWPFIGEKYISKMQG